jgi:diguanylate cyclase (GGDEF)-like protein
LHDAAGPGDLAARNGGDEFCLVLTDTEKSRAVERADALCKAIASIDTAPLRHGVSAAGVRITASIGVAAYPADVLSANGLLELADVAMYHCKRTGRNGVAFQDRNGVDRYRGPCSDHPTVVA